MSKTKPAKTPNRRPPHVMILAEDVSAAVIGEYLAITSVSAAEILELEEGTGPVTPRLAAVAIRMSEPLRIDPPFRLGGRFHIALARAQQYMRLLTASNKERAA